MYPLDLMQKVIDELALDSKNKLFLFGGGTKEIKVLNSFSTSKKNIIVVAGKLNLEQELQLISNLDVMLSMDSSNGHLAALFGIKVVTLWGATHPYAGFSPFNQLSEYSLVADRALYPLLPTSVYGNKKVPGYEAAMRTISVKQVVDKLSES
jgi:ADP-heptose:LPS heptosyltransferase